MMMLYVILPLALAFAGLAVAAFAWTVRSGQLDDVDTPPRRILFEDDRADRARAVAGTATLAQTAPPQTAGAGTSRE